VRWLGACGFHLAEMDTALTHRLPVVIAIGNGATWNAEHQLQARDRERPNGLRERGDHPSPGARPGLNTSHSRVCKDAGTHAAAAILMF
jgi:hypothetical protein